MLEKKFIKIGNSYGIVIDRNIFELLGVDPGKYNARIVLQDGKIVIHPTLKGGRQGGDTS